MNTRTKIEPLFEQIHYLDQLLNQFQKENDDNSRVALLDSQDRVKNFLAKNPSLEKYIKHFPDNLKYLCKALLAIGQGSLVFQGMDQLENPSDELRAFLEEIATIDEFYKEIGGIIGYHLAVLKLIYAKEQGFQSQSADLRFLKPQGVDISSDSSDLRHAIRQGIENFPKLAQIFPVGGAGDRLNLIDEESGQPLPAAELQFGGRTLLEGLIRDLQGLEYLYYKLIGQQVITPLALMTSHEKDNHHHISMICEQRHWFGRHPKNFKLFIQPLVPVITTKGYWAVSGPLKLLFKPGGHGVIWKLVETNQIFEYFHSNGRDKALVRQINNPVSGIDYGLLAFAGVGFEKHKAFGFASCPRPLGIAEGMDILVERKIPSGYEYHISNIEYTDFIQKGIEDIPCQPGSPYSAFPANTNILFVDLIAIKNALKTMPFPGMLVNMKNVVTCLNLYGEFEKQEAGRLETLMQNLSDAIVDKFPKPLKANEQDQLRTYLTYNQRQKTISVTKKSFIPGHSMEETPEGCFYQLLQNTHGLLSSKCQIEVPAIVDENAYLAKGPSFIFDYHPALGPLWSVVAQKIQGGKISQGAELRLEIAELELSQLKLKGSLIIIAEDLLGHHEKEMMQYSEHTGKCVLKNVTVHNRGIDYAAKNIYWKNEISRHQSLKILLKGNAEFFAENIIFDGDFQIEVPNGYRMTALEKDSKIDFQLSKLDQPSWHWKYAFDHEDRVVLRKTMAT